MLVSFLMKSTQGVSDTRPSVSSGLTSGMSSARELSRNLPPGNGIAQAAPANFLPRSARPDATSDMLWRALAFFSLQGSVMHSKVVAKMADEWYATSGRKTRSWKDRDEFLSGNVSLESENGVTRSDSRLRLRKVRVVFRNRPKLCRGSERMDEKYSELTEKTKSLQFRTTTVG